MNELIVNLIKSESRVNIEWIKTALWTPLHLLLLLQSNLIYFCIVYKSDITEYPEHFGLALAIFSNQPVQSLALLMFLILLLFTVGL